MKYTDKKGIEIKDGDLMYYSEPIPYAESIHVVKMIDGSLKGKTVVGSVNGVYFKCDDEPAIDLKYYCDTGNFITSDATVIGNIFANPEMATVEYANKNYPLTQTP